MIRARHALLFSLASCTPSAGGGSPIFVAAALVIFAIRRVSKAVQHVSQGDASRPRRRPHGWRGA